MNSRDDDKEEGNDDDRKVKNEYIPSPAERGGVGANQMRILGSEGHQITCSHAQVIRPMYGGSGSVVC